MNHYERRTKRLREGYLKKIQKKKKANIPKNDPWEEKLEKYAVLNDKGIETGWYDIPGQESKIQGKEKAIQALKESDS